MAKKVVKKKKSSRKSVAKIKPKIKAKPPVVTPPEEKKVNNLLNRNRAKPKEKEESKSKEKNNEELETLFPDESKMKHEDFPLAIRLNYEAQGKRINSHND